MRYIQYFAIILVYQCRCRYRYRLTAVYGGCSKHTLYRRGTAAGYQQTCRNKTTNLLVFRQNCNFLEYTRTLSLKHGPTMGLVWCERSCTQLITWKTRLPQRAPHRVFGASQTTNRPTIHASRASCLKNAPLRSRGSAPAGSHPELATIDANALATT